MRPVLRDQLLLIGDPGDRRLLGRGHVPGRGEPPVGRDREGGARLPHGAGGRRQGDQPPAAPAQGIDADRHVHPVDARQGQQRRAVERVGGEVVRQRRGRPGGPQGQARDERGERGGPS